MRSWPLILVLLLAACPATISTDPEIAAVQRVSALCDTYSSTVISLAGFRAAGKLSPAQVLAVDQSISVAGPVCTGPQPSEQTARSVLDSLEEAMIQMTIVQESAQ